MAQSAQAKSNAVVGGNFFSACSGETRRVGVVFGVAFEAAAQCRRLNIALPARDTALDNSYGSHLLHCRERMRSTVRMKSMARSGCGRQSRGPRLRNAF